MYAIVSDRNKQYRVTEGDRIIVDRLEVAAGDKIEFKDVLFYRKENDVRIGAPMVGNVVVTGKVVDPEYRGEKLVVFRYRPRKDSKKKRGHRQQYTRVVIESIQAK